MQPLDQPKLRKSRIDFLLVQVRDDAEVQRNVSTAYLIAEHYGANRPGELIDELSRSLGNAIKIVHGSEVGHSGFLVGKTQMGHSVILPHFTEARHRVESLEWGQIVEFQK